MLLINLTIKFRKYLLESAKLRALHAKNVIACQCALRAYLLMCQCALHAYVPTCLACLRDHMPTCLVCLHGNVLTWQNALCAYVLVCKYAILNNINLYIIQICELYLLLKRGNIGEMLVNYWDLLVWISTSMSVVFRGLGMLKMFGERNLGKCTMYIGIAVMVMPRLCCPVCHFHQF